MMEGIRDLLRRALASIYRIPGNPARTLGQHRVIVRAMAAGSADGARAAMRRHLTRVEQDIRGVLDDAAEDTGGPP